MPQDVRPVPFSGPETLSREEIESIARLLPYLSYGVDGLELEGVPVRRLWNGSRPLLLHLPQRAVDNFTALHAAFSAHFDVRVHCAVKACYVPEVLRALRAAGAGIEVMSDLEWRLARSAGFTADRIVSDSIARPVDHLERLLRAPHVTISVDGERELESVEWHAKQFGARPTIVIRANLLPADEFFSTSSKLGTEPNEAYALLERAAASPHLDLAGIHAHQLIHCAGVARFAAQAGAAAELAAAFATLQGTRLRVINLGGGLESRFLMERAGTSCQDLAAAAREAMGPAPPGYRLLLEPGRFVFADAAVALTGIIAERRKSGQDWLITAVAGNLLRPVRDRSFPPLPVRWSGDRPWRRWHVGDPTSTPSRLWLDALLPEDVARDGLALLDVGAYTAVRASLWGSELPDMGIFHDGDVEITFGEAQQAALARALYGVDLDW
ncbi:alanine racemase [Streptomyces sp. NPDC051183]|uniref:alanine racemase n=1 Tax=Streptomyces sp. NPDC051183 TaxID=3155165 RepID=UPI003434709F